MSKKINKKLPVPNRSGTIDFLTIVALFLEKIKSTIVGCPGFNKGPLYIDGIAIG